MSLSSVLTKVQYNGDDSTTAFAVTFVFYDDSDLRVIETDTSTGVETVKALTTHYTLSGGDGSTGTLTMLVAPATGTTLTIKSNIADLQETSLPAGGKFPSAAVERRLDIITRLIQQQAEEIARAVTLAESSATGSIQLPEPTANRALVWNSAGDNLENSDSDPDAQTTAAAASAAAAAASETAAAASAVTAGNAASAVAMPYTFNTTTTMADPAGTFFRANSATPASITALALGDTNADGVDLSAFVADWASSGSTIKGQLRIVQEDDPSIALVFNVTAVTDNTDWLQLTVAHVAGATLFGSAKKCRFLFTRTGDVGSTGATGPEPTNNSDTFSGDGATVAFVITTDATNSDRIYGIQIGGVLQPPSIISSYDSGTKTVTLTDAPPSGTNNLIIHYWT